MPQAAGDMNKVEALKRTEQLAEFQSYWAKRSAAVGMDADDAVAVVRRVLKQDA